jgi:hypothetical protein
VPAPTIKPATIKAKMTLNSLSTIHLLRVGQRRGNGRRPPDAYNDAADLRLSCGGRHSEMSINRGPERTCQARLMLPDSE